MTIIVAKGSHDTRHFVGAVDQLTAADVGADATGAAAAAQAAAISTAAATTTASVTAEAAARTAADTAEAAARITGDSTEATARTAAITAEAASRVAGDASTLTAAEAYADTAIEAVTGGAQLGQVKAAATGNVSSLSGGVTEDGVALTPGVDRVLLPLQTTAAQNGIWVIQTGAWTRPIDYATGAAIPAGKTVEVLLGTANKLTTWEVTGTGNIDTAASTWTEMHSTLLTVTDGDARYAGVNITVPQTGGTAVAVTKVLETALTPEMFGAAGNGTTDDTTALTEWATAVVTAGSVFGSTGRGTGGKNYKITASIQIPVGFGYTLDLGGATVTQSSNNVPVFEFVGTTPHAFRLTNGVIAYTTQQTPSNTHSVAIAFHTTGGAYGFEVDHLYFQNCYRQIGQYDVTATNPLWGWDIHHINAEATCTGATLAIQQTSAGQPNCSAHHVFAVATANTTEEVISLSNMEILLENIEIIQYSRRIMLLNQCSVATLHQIRAENGSLTTNFDGLYCFENGVYNVTGFRVYNHTSNVANLTGLIRGITNAKIHVSGAECDTITISGGSLDFFWGDNTSTFELDDNHSFTGLSATINASIAGQQVVHTPWTIVLPILDGLPHTGLVGTWAKAQQGTQVGNGQLFNSTAAQHDAFVIPIVMGAGTWDLDVDYFEGSDHGIVTAALDDGNGTYTTLGTFDGYHATSIFNQTFSVSFSGPASPRVVHLKLSVDSKNATSTGYYASLSAAKLERTA